MKSTALLFVCGAALVGAAVDPCGSDVCQFKGKDAANCSAIGQLGDGVLRAYTACSQDCLDDLNIKREAIDPDLLATLFPNPDGTGGSASGLVNYLRFDGSSVAMSLRAGFPTFFMEDPDVAGKVILRETVGGVDCTTNESGCYSQLTTYLKTTQGSTEMAQVGQTLWNNVALSKELEQGLCRIRGCQYYDGDDADAAAATSTCADAFSAVADIRAGTTKACSAFALGPAAQACGGGGSTSPDAAQEDGAGAHAACSAAALALAAVAAAVLTL
ncbi:hypothetical protein JKP88DRAFT_291342 [Tribonema minus]|uniref:Uncharacterized protein n=1 Tax=Tribonema minus TaxID=303371 RepID=A0A836CPJ5_9STRA|nr:hypothetical protein JKP88DRAFT_291342 [Tribonema minus]